MTCSMYENTGGYGAVKSHPEHYCCSEQQACASCILHSHRMSQLKTTGAWLADKRPLTSAVSANKQDSIRYLSDSAQILQDLDPLSTLPKLRHLSLLDNPVTKQPNYRCVFSLPFDNLTQHAALSCSRMHLVSQSKKSRRIAAHTKLIHGTAHR